MNYSTLLHPQRRLRHGYAHREFVDELPDTPLGLYDNYPNELERPLLLRAACRCCGTAPRPTATRST